MGTSVSKHSRRDRLPDRRIIWVGALIAAFSVATFFAFPIVASWQICRDRAFVCENTGSHKGYREWWTGHRSGQWYHESRLERFMREQHPSALKNRWTSYEGTGRNILGQAMSFGHAFPQLGMVIMTRGLFDRYVDTLDDAAKLDLYRLLVSGDREAIQAEDQKIGEIALARGWPFK